MNEPQLFPATRHDGWTGERIAAFCETLAETAVVAEACDAARMGISGAYAARRRNPVFAAAWDAALTIARQRLADTLLARSMEGNVEQLYKDGELIGERHVIDNRLGLQMLRRLDRLAERSLCSCAGRAPGQTKSLGPRMGPEPIDWNFAVEALRSGDDEGAARALALSESNEVEEVEGGPNLPLSEREDAALDLSDRCWWDEEEEIWFTDFPPPENFDGDEDGLWGTDKYQRTCTAEEVAVLEADRAAEQAAERAEDEALRDEYFSLLKEEAADRHPGLEPGSACTSAEVRERGGGPEFPQSVVLVPPQPILGVGRGQQDRRGSEPQSEDELPGRDRR